MNERRAEQRLMCSDLVTVRVENQDQPMVANLEDISPSGACLEIERPVPRDATLVMDCSNCRFRGKVRYCVFRQSGYQVGVRFTECKWSKDKYAPRHLLDATGEEWIMIRRLHARAVHRRRSPVSVHLPGAFGLLGLVFCQLLLPSLPRSIH